MILPIYAYGQTVLRKVATPIDKDYPELPTLLDNMWQTMNNAHGVGLAAPQIGLSIRVFLVDTTEVQEEGKESDAIKKVFINAEKIEESGEEYAYEEGCLSIPDLRGEVERPSQLRIRWQDENFETHEEVFTGINARVIQHEYDHIEGILFTDYLKPIKKRLSKRKLEKIKAGKFEPPYKMRFAGSKKRR
ncbi:MAG: peptide deformylase [Bacteroidota bacterium]